MKRLLLLAFLVATVLLLAPAVAAEGDLNDLNRAKSNMETYVIPFLQEKPAYEKFKPVFDSVSLFLAEGEKTEDSIRREYDRLIEAYAELMRTTFDYSGIESMYERYLKMSDRVFTPESWAPFQLAAEQIEAELKKPRLFARSSQHSDNDYQDAIDKHTINLEEEFIKTFNALDAIVPTGNVSRPDFNAFTYYVSYCVPREIFAATTTWFEFDEQLSNMLLWIGWRNPAQWRINTGPSTLMALYQPLFFEMIDMSEVEKLIAELSTIPQEDYTAASYQRYRNAVVQLEAKSKIAPLLYFPENASEYELKEQVNQYIFNITAPVLKAKEDLITHELVDELNQSIEKFSTLVSREGAERKWTAFSLAMDDAKALLLSDSATATDFVNATTNLENAGFDYQLALEFLDTEGDRIRAENQIMIRNVGAIALAVAAFSFLLAVLVSYLKNKRMIWGE